MRRLPVALCALAPLSIGAAGLLHPTFLTPDTADRWFLAHLLLLPLFPLLGAVVWWLLRGDRTPAAWLARVAAYAYAVGYTALDSIAGVGLSWQVMRATDRGEPGPALGDAFQIGDRIGHAGVWALAASVVVAALVLRPRTGPLVLLGGALAAASCVPFVDGHVFSPRGTLAMAGLAVGLGLMAYARESSTGSPTSTSGSDSGAASTTASASASGP